MQQQTYIDTYRQLLKKPNLNKADVKRFKQAVQSYTYQFPQWEETQNI